MTKSVFRKFLFFSLAVTLISLIVVCGILAFPVSKQIKDYKRSSLEESSQIVAEYAGNISYGTNSIRGNDFAIANNAFDSMSESMRAFIIVVDKDGILLYSSDKSMTPGAMRLHPAVMDKLKHGNYYEHGTLQNTYNKRYYISAVPYYCKVHSNEILGYCLVAQTSLWTADYTPTIFGIIFLIIVVTATLIFILSTVYAYNTTRPLKQMADAAKRFAVGDFESRGHIKSNDEIGELATAFNEMADSLASSEGMRRNFIANVSHELKTPMTTIAGYIDGILDNTIPKEEQDYYLGIISHEIKRLNRLVTSMISLSKIDSGEITLKKSPFVIQDTVFNVLLGFEGEIEKKHLSIEGLESDGDMKIYGDADLIHQVLYNLVENAIKFTDNNGYIRFGFAQKDNRAYVYVENSGEGIPPEDIRLVFDKFYKADKSRSINKKSMGLGLYIVRSIILLHGGNIGVESEQGSYTRFTFWIPDIPKKQKELPEIIKEEN